MSRRRKKVSAAQLEANRLNAQKSTGPRTEEGKNKCKLNAFRHGLTSQVAVMTDPDRDAQEKFIKALVVTIVRSIHLEQWYPPKPMSPMSNPKARRKPS